MNKSNRKYGVRHIAFNQKPKVYVVSFRACGGGWRSTIEMELYACDAGERVYEAMRLLKGVGTRVRVEEQVG